MVQITSWINLNNFRATKPSALLREDHPVHHFKKKKKIDLRRIENVNKAINFGRRCVGRKFSESDTAGGRGEGEFPVIYEDGDVTVGYK